MVSNMKPNLIPGSEAFKFLGFKNRSSLTRLVQSGEITPAFTASGKRGEQFFLAKDIDRLKAERVAA